MAGINPISFVGGASGEWRVTSMKTITGESIAEVPFIHAVTSHTPPLDQAPRWVLKGTNSQVRYTERPEVTELTQRQSGLGRTEATCASLIPIRKNAAWWAMSQEERRDVFEAQSHHIALSMPFLPAIARRLYHSRDLGEPFDFLTWFEFAPEHTAEFDALVAELRATKEWTFVDREVDIRLSKTV